MGSGFFGNGIGKYVGASMTGGILPIAEHFFGKSPGYSGPNSIGPYTGVAPTLAGANAGYTAGGPGSTPGVENAPSAYVNAARNATQQRSPGYGWGG